VASDGSGQQEGTPHAKDIAGHEQPENDQAAPVNPRQDTGQVHRTHLGAAQAVVDRHRGQQ
jgi:hypothetical protein